MWSFEKLIDGIRFQQVSTANILMNNNIFRFKVVVVVFFLNLRSFYYFSKLELLGDLFLKVEI